MKYNIIVACTKNRGIGYENSLPWKISSDLKKFRDLTIGNGNNAVIMGKNTWTSLPIKYLKSRDNLILSTTLKLSTCYIDNNDNNDNNDDNDNIYSRSTLIKVFSEIETMIAYCNKAQYDCVWIIGGAEIYNLFLDRANTIQDIEISEIHITWIDQDFICDTFFPDIETPNENYQYKMVSESLHNVVASYKVYDRVYHLSK